MATLVRQFGQEISGNRPRLNELSNEARASIYTAYNTGQSCTAIANAFQVHRSTVYRTLEHFQNNNTFTSSPRSGRPKKLNQSQERRILHIVRRSTRITNKQLYNQAKHEFQDVSSSTIRRVLRTNKVRKWRAAKRIPLNKSDVKERLAFVRY